MRALTIDERVDAYLEAVRDHLQDVPEGERNELLDDLRDHLFEVAAEDGADLEGRLGPPERYAAELRSSAGLASPGARRSWRDRFSGTVLGQLVRTAKGTAAYGAVTEFLPELRPGWWVLRGYLAVVAVDAILGTNTHGVVPSMLGSQVVGLAAIAGAIWLSVSLGRREPLSGSARLGVWAITPLVVLVGTAALGGAPAPIYVQEHVADRPFLEHADGEPIANICPYTADGEPLSDVLLFDGRGRPIENVAPILEDGRPETGPLNAYPLSGTMLDPQTGEQVPHRCPRIIVTQPAEPVETPRASSDEAPTPSPAMEATPQPGTEASPGPGADPTPAP